MPFERRLQSRSVLILAPSGRDAPSIARVLGQRSLPCRVVASLDELATCVDDTAGAVVVTSEALLKQDARALLQALEDQPAWSDLPFVYLAERRTGRPLPGAGPRESLPSQINHVMVLERPLGADSLVSAVEWALSARARQFQVRDHMEELSRRAEQLRESEHALRVANERMTLALNSGLVMGTWVWDLVHQTVVGDERFASTFGLDPAALDAGLSAVEVGRAVHGSELGKVRQRMAAAIAKGGSYRAEHRLKVAGRGWRWLEAHGHIEKAADGTPLRFPGVLIDIDERKAAEQALQNSEAELRLVADSLPVLIAFIDRHLTFRFANRACEHWCQVAPERLVGRRLNEVTGLEGLREREQAVEAALAGRAVTLQAPWPHPDGRPRHADIRYLPRFDAEGQVDGFHVFVLDVTDREEAAEILRRAHGELEAKVSERTAALHAEMQDRQRAEEALRQSQKMEAVGQLTGGIAHDFNNLLQGITGSLSVIKKRLDEGRAADLDRFIGGAMKSAQRAAALTHRLLAFSRRQPLDAKPARVNELVETLHELLARTLGEQVVLEFTLADDLWLTLCDANQLESSLLNLAINARDAMPDGGRLLIHTGNAHLEPGHPDLLSQGGTAEPGDYVCVAVTDTGIGMGKDVMDRAFDPFFTTKPIGQGTGLGLSMIYGFARQSQGFCKIESRVGAGTTVRIYLPRWRPPVADEDAASTVGEAALLAPEAPVPALSGAREGEVVLVIEDDEIVRGLVLDALQEAGYQALQASDGPAGLELLRQPLRIDLLLTDVGLPGLNGRQVADAARVLRPQLKVLLMTGYAETAAIPSGFLAPGMALITKPFAIDTLAARVRQMMQSPVHGLPVVPPDPSLSAVE